MSTFSRKLSRIFIFVFVLVILFSITLRAQITDFGNINFRKADSVAALYPNHSLVDLKQLSDKLTKPLPTEVEKYRAIYTWVSKNIEYDFDLFKKNKYKRKKLKDKSEEISEWNETFAPFVVKKLLKTHTTVCTGYAALIQTLANYAGLSCKIIDGYGRTAETNLGGEGIANHSWNAIQLNNKWYLSDPTWTSGIFDVQQYQFIKRFDDEYFLTSPELFIQNHYPLDTNWFLLTQKPSLQEFLNRPLIYIGALRFEIIPIVPETFDIKILKGDTLTFRFNKMGVEKMEKVELQINQGAYRVTANPEVKQDDNGYYNIQHIFNSKGIYDVHLLIGWEYIFTYKVTVLKK